MHLESVMYVATEPNQTVFSPSHEPLLDFLMSAFYFSKTFSVVYNIVYIFLFGKWAFLCHPKGWHLPAHYFVKFTRITRYGFRRHILPALFTSNFRGRLICNVVTVNKR